MSDLHLEFGPLDFSVENIDVLVAAGDIDVGKTGLQWLRRFSCPIVYIAGNHEYWGEDLDRFTHQLTQCTHEGDVYFLENQRVDIKGVRFLGCTLWTDYKQADTQIMDEMLLKMNDFRFISKGARPLQPADLVHVNAQSKAWLEQELNSPFTGKTVVVTHHAPLMQSWYDHSYGNIQYAYCNDLKTLMDQHQQDIDLWVHGHVHESFDYIAHGIRVVCNPRGYFGYKEVNDFDPDKCISL